MGGVADGARHWPDLDGAVRLAVQDRQAAREAVVRLAGDVPVRQLAAFLEQACRESATAGAPELATELFDLARKSDDYLDALLGITPDPDAVQRAFVEFGLIGMAGPDSLRKRLRRLATERDHADAHRKGRELALALIDSGTIPDIDLLDGFVGLAAKANADNERELLAERVLRRGLLREAAPAVWKAFDSALASLGRSAPELLDLLIESEPNGEAARALWLTALAHAGAGARLSREWFFELGPSPADALMRLVQQAGERIFPGVASELYYAASDPAAFESSPDPLAFVTAKRSDFDRGPGATWHSLTDFTELAEPLDRDPDARKTFSRNLDEFVRTLGYYSNVDYADAVRRMRQHPALDAILREHADDWRGEIESNDLTGLEIALPRLVPLAEAGYVEPLADLAPAHPVEILYHALHTGIPEEFRFPVVEIAGSRPSIVRTVQHRDFLSITIDDASVRVLDGTEAVVAQSDLPSVDRLVAWYDGHHHLLSHHRDPAPMTYTLTGGKALALDAATVNSWPEGDGAAAVIFPGATASSLVRLHRGVIRLSAPDGTVTARLRFGAQWIDPGTNPVLPPPGWWPKLAATDPVGSAALREIDGETVEQLVDAAFAGPAAAAKAVSRALPEITEPLLRHAVTALALRAADCLVKVVRLRDALGLERPARLPSRLGSDSGLRSGRETTRIPAIRALAASLREAADGRRAEIARPLGVIELPPGTGGTQFTFGLLGAKAIEASWPWTTESERSRILDTLGAWGDTPWGDASGHWRRLDLTSRAGRQEPTGELWQTPNGALLMLTYQDHPHKQAIAVEYSPDGDFQPFDLPGWATTKSPVPQGWGGADRIRGYLSWLAERGPAPYDTTGVRALAERTGLPLPDVASACLGYPFYAGRGLELARYPEEVLDLFRDPTTGEKPQKSPQSYELERIMREALMPDDPTELWTRGIDVDRVAAWWANRSDR